MTSRPKLSAVYYLSVVIIAVMVVVSIWWLLRTTPNPGPALPESGVVAERKESERITQKARTAPARTGEPSERAPKTADRQAREVASEESEPVDVPRFQANLIQGRVVDWDHQPIPGAQITVIRNDREETTLATDAGGRFRIEPGAWPLGLVARHTGYVSEIRTLTALPEQSLEIMLKPISGFFARVVDPERVPLTSYRIRVSPYSAIGFKGKIPEYFNRWLDVEDAGGEFELQEVEAGVELKIIVAAEGYGTELFGPFMVPSQPADKPEILVLKNALGTVSGRVTDVKGNPLAGITVILSGGETADMTMSRFRWKRLSEDGYPNRAVHQTAVTPGDGSFSFYRPSEEFGFDLLFMGEGYALHRLPALHHRDPESVEQLEVILDPEARIIGKLNRSTIEGSVKISVQHRIEKDVVLDHLIYNDESSYAFDNLAPGDYLVKAYGIFDEKLRLRTSVTLAAGETAVVDFGFEGKTSLTGLALRGGEAFVDGVISIFPEPAGYFEARVTQPDESGQFRFDDMVPGVYTVVARHQPFNKELKPDPATLMHFPNRVTIDLPQEGLSRTFTFEPYSTVSGRIVSSRIRNLLLIGDYLGRANRLTAEPDSRDRFVITDVLPGIYQLMAITEENTGMINLGEFEVTSGGGDIDLGDIGLGETGSLEVTIIGFAEPTGPGYVMMVKDESNKIQSSQFLGMNPLENQNPYLVSDLPAGNLAVAVVKEMGSWETGWHRVTVYPGETAAAALELKPVTLLTITLPEVGPAFAQVQMTHLDTGDIKTIVNDTTPIRLGRMVGPAAGFFGDRFAFIKGVAPGRWQVVVTMADGQERAYTVLLKPGEPQRLGD
ncbi:MAG: carboxypeptidase-like regulatory domain-containing protein [Acidobacteriota bacterium]|nr:carboxypeptidase-like regulatory domain-containing protein [Acidobacteriota bacterium]